MALAQSVFTQQGPKLVGSGAVGNGWQGTSVALSADGNTAIVGGSGSEVHSNADNNSQIGAAWVYTRSNGVWSQQGGKLVESGASGPANQGNSVGLPGDGHTAIVGGYADNSQTGAAWVYTRSGGVWTQHGGKLVGTGAPTPDLPHSGLNGHHIMTGLVELGGLEGAFRSMTISQIDGIRETDIRTERFTYAYTALSHFLTVSDR